MRRLFLLLSIASTVALPAEFARANDVDGPGDCSRFGADFGDAPEDQLAYPGVFGRFPTCLSQTTPGTQEAVGCFPTSTLPGVTGFVQHLIVPQGFWLGCQPAVEIGIDSELDGKTSLSSPTSSCNPSLSTDCSEIAFSLNFGQDECLGDNDAGLVGPVTFVTCATGRIEYRAANCGSTREVYLNVLIDFNHDGDWNDAELCPPPGACAPEWAVQNVLFPLVPGCNLYQSPVFNIGNTPGPAWLRITISDLPAPPEFPWAGTEQTGASFIGGETEDYPVTIIEQGECPTYLDYGDAPEGQTAYSNGIVGRFPTCEYLTPSSTMEISPPCVPSTTFPGNPGFVRHQATPLVPDQFWLGCPVPGGVPPDAVDSEDDGKVNLTGGGIQSDCDPAVITDCTETFGGLNFGQDECYGDADAGIDQPLVYDACQGGIVTFKGYNCSQQQQIVYYNILVDWNQDGDWNDVLQCPQGQCAPEWAIKNQLYVLSPGCNTVFTPPFQIGPQGGEGWLRLTITRDPVPDDFAWNGSAGIPGETFNGGETEDYPVRINDPLGQCEPYNDMGDAPEGFLLFPGALGSVGAYPTCISSSLPSTQELLVGCGATSTPPGPSGYVVHVSPLGATQAAWLGCGIPGVDSEPEGKTNLTNILGQFSHCDPSLLVDCDDTTIGTSYGADECPGDGDAGIASPIVFQRCEPTSFAYDAYNCTPHQVTMYLNVLVDWNSDGDWNDVGYCPFQGGCAPEWSVKNYAITLAPGCNSLSTPQFQTGRYGGWAWMRLTITFQPVTDDFPWAGSANLPGGAFDGGETEDYVFYIDAGETPCLDLYVDQGDAPEGLTAYPSGVVGNFPTCEIGGGVSTQSFPAGCAPISTPPSASGYVVHVNEQVYPPFWLGCAMSPPPTFAVDHDGRAKVNLTGAFLPTQCPSGQGITTDCHENYAFHAPLVFGQDECYGDLDAGLAVLHEFPGCGINNFDFEAESCWDQTLPVYLNVLVDWNRDGDWNDVERCGPQGACAPEWAVKNHVVMLQPGCNVYTTPLIQAAGPDGPAWMRLTLTPTPVNDDFPWAGSTTEPPGHHYYDGGETEDYIVRIVGSPVGADPSLQSDLYFGPALPNPARELTTARFVLPSGGTAQVSVFDAAGRLVRTLVDGAQPAGEHSVSWDYRDADGVRVPAGVYLMRLEFAGRSLTQRIVRLR
jgi:hypothetical protein